MYKLGECIAMSKALNHFPDMNQASTLDMAIMFFNAHLAGLLDDEKKGQTSKPGKNPQLKIK